MKHLYICLLIIVFLPTHFLAQSNDMASMLVYRKQQDTWVLWMKNEFIRSPFLQSNTGYRWIDEQWKKTSVHAREVSLNIDTIQTWITNYNVDPPKKKVSMKCYAIRNSEGERIDGMFELEGVPYPSWEPNLQPLDSMWGGQQLPYPYHNFFEHAAKQLAVGESEENIHPKFVFCREKNRPDEVFSLTFNEKQQIVAFESDSSKVLVIYRDDTEQKDDKPFQLLYPNPFYDALYIDFVDPAVEQINVVNYMGETVYSAAIQPGQPTLRINLHHLPTGVYLVNLVSEKATHSSKVLKIE